MSILILFAVLFTLMFLGVEIFLSMGIAAAVYLLHWKCAAHTYSN